MAGRRDVRAVPGRPVVGERELAGLLRRLPHRTAATAGAARPTGRAGRRRAGGRPPPAPAAPAPARAAAGAAPADGRRALGEPIRGAAARIVANMEASLDGPDGHQLPRGAGQAARGQPQVINGYLGRTRGGKVSFTHLIGYAVVRAIADTCRSMNSHVRRGRRRQARRRPPRARQPRPRRRRREGRRLAAPCSSRCIKDADTLDFRGFWAAYEDLIRKVRTNKLAPDDFAGATVTLTNPGTIGTVPVGAAAHAGPGRHRRRRARSTTRPSSRAPTPQTLADLGVSKVITLTSTYDHRIIQGAESGLFLKQVHELLLGEDGFYDDIFRSLGVPYEAVQWRRDVNPVDRERVDAREADAGADRSSTCTACAATSSPTSTRWRGRSRHAHRARPGHLRAHHLGPRPRVPHRRPRRHASACRSARSSHVLRDAYCRTIGIEYMHIQEPEREALDPGAGRGRRRRRSTPDEQRHILDRLNAAEALREVPRHEVRRPEALRHRGRRVGHPDPRRGPRARRPTPTSTRAVHRHGPPRPAQRARQHRRQVATTSSSRSSRATSTPTPPRARAT